MLDLQLKQSGFSDPKALHSVTLRHVSLAPISEMQCVQIMTKAIEVGQGGWCITVNLENLRKTLLDPQLYQLVESSTLRVADGITLVWASQLQGTPLPERVCGSNLIYSLTHELSRRDGSIFLLGGNPGTAEKAAAFLMQKYPNIQIVGISCPPFGFEHDPVQMECLQQQISAAQPDVVYVALGFPKSEQLIAKLRLAYPQAWWVGVGISFSYVAGDLKRPPKWAQNLGIETVYRLIQEPRRLGRRYLVDGPFFAMKLLASSLFRRLR